MNENRRLYTTSQFSCANRPSALQVTNQTVICPRLIGYIHVVNMIRSLVIESLIFQGSQVAIKHVIHNMDDVL